MTHRAADLEVPPGGTQAAGRGLPPCLHCLGERFPVSTCESPAPPGRASLGPARCHPDPLCLHLHFLWPCPQAA